MNWSIVLETQSSNVLEMHWGPASAFSKTPWIGWDIDLEMNWSKVLATIETSSWKCIEGRLHRPAFFQYILDKTLSWKWIGNMVLEMTWSIVLNMDWSNIFEMHWGPASTAGFFPYIFNWIRHCLGNEWKHCRGKEWKHCRGNALKQCFGNALRTSLFSMHLQLDKTLSWN